MNHLAHFHLASGEPGLLIGALLGDHIKGPLRGEWPAAWEDGIRLHRQIDAYTDRHPLLKEAHALLAPPFQRYRGILLDVYFDHLLSRHWSQFAAQPLADFCAEVMALLVQSALPPAAQQQARNLARYDVLVNYQRWDMVEGTLARIGTRLRRDNPLAEAGAELRRQHAQLEPLFWAFYPDLQAQVRALRGRADERPGLTE